MRLTRRRFLLGCVAVPVAATLPAGETLAWEPEMDLSNVIVTINPTDSPFLSLVNRAGSESIHEWVNDELMLVE